MILSYGFGEDSWASIGQQGDETSQSSRKSILNIHWNYWCWNETPILWPPHAKSLLIRTDSDAGKDEGRRRRGQQRMRWLDCSNWHEFGQAVGDGEPQGSLACSRPWGHKESDRILWLSNDKINKWLEYLNRHLFKENIHLPRNRWKVLNITSY